MIVMCKSIVFILNTLNRDLFLSDLSSYLSLCTYIQDKIYMYGGKIDSTGNVTSELWVFHTRNQTWALLNPRAKEQYAVVGHSAHTVQLYPDGSEPVILVVFGHSPLYGYISKVQQYNIGQ